MNNIKNFSLPDCFQKMSPLEFSDWLVKEFQGADHSKATYRRMMDAVNEYRKSHGLAALSEDEVIFNYDSRAKVLDICLAEKVLK